MLSLQVLRKGIWRSAHCVKFHPGVLVMGGPVEDHEASASLVCTALATTGQALGEAFTSPFVPREGYL